MTQPDTPQPDTGKQPEREYRITESELGILTYDGLETLSYKRERDRVICEIRSRTITPAPEQPAPPRDRAILIREIIFVFHQGGRIDPRVELWLHNEIEEYEAALIQRTREEVLDLLTSECSVRAFVDSDGDVHYGSLTLDEIQDIFRSQPPTTGSTTSPAKGKEGKKAKTCGPSCEDTATGMTR